MDPDVMLVRLRELAERINHNPRYHTVEEREFAEWFHDLDEWLSHGGFAPSAWQSTKGNLT